MAKGTAKKAKEPERIDRAKIALDAAEKRRVDEVAGLTTAHETEIELLQDKLAQAVEMRQTALKALGQKASALIGKGVFSVAVLTRTGDNAAWLSYLGAAADNQGAQASALACAMAAGADSPVVAECNLVGKLDFA